MKAYSCTVRGLDEPAVIVFADTRGKAHAATLNQANDAGFDVRWPDVSTKRARKFDGCVYRYGYGETLEERPYKPSDLIPMP